MQSPVLRYISGMLLPRTIAGGFASCSATHSGKSSLSLMMPFRSLMAIVKEELGVPSMEPYILWSLRYSTKLTVMLLPSILYNVRR